MRVEFQERENVLDSIHPKKAGTKGENNRSDKRR